MGFQISPGVNVTEIDLTTIIPAVGTTVGAIAGPFAWGPAYKPMLVDSELTLVSEFGKPDNSCANNWFTAANFLAYGNALQTVRIVKLGTEIAVVPANGDGTGRGATAKIGVDPTTGAITSVTPVTYGEFYQSTPSVAIVDENGANAIIQAHLGTGSNDDKVMTYTIIQPGSGYVIGHKNATSSGAGLLIQNEDQYLNQYSYGDSGVGMFAAKYAGDLGNSLAVSIADADSFAAWDYNLEFSGIPNTSTTVVQAGGNNDEIHVVVVDLLGLWTGTPGTVLERFPFLSKCPSAIAEDGSTMYYPEVINRTSSYVWWMDHPTPTDLGLDNQETVNWGQDKSTNFDTTAMKLVYNNISGGPFVVGETLSDGAGVALSTGSGAVLGDAVIGAGGILSIPVTGPGSGYTVAPNVVISAPPSGGTQAFAVAVLGTGGSAGTVDHIQITNPGAGYTSATASISSGSGASATAVVNGGTVTGFTNLVSGSNYVTAPTVTLTVEGSGVGTTPPTITVTLGTGINAGKITAITATGGSSDWGTTPPLVTIAAVGSGATTGTITYNTGQIVSIPVTHGGTGYGGSPTITLTGGGGTSAVAVPVISGGIIQSVVISNAGSGYVSAPIATVVPVGTGASAAVTVNANGRVIAVTPTNVGTGYTVPPAVTIIGPGSGASVTANIDNSGHVVGFTVGAGGSGYATISAKVLAVDTPLSLLSVSPIYGLLEADMTFRGSSTGATATVVTFSGGPIMTELSGGVNANSKLLDGEYFSGLDKFKSGEDIDVNLLVTADANPIVQNYAIQDIAEYRMDCVAFLSPPQNLVVNNAGNEAADIVTYRNTLPTSSYSVMDSGWKYQYDKYSDIYRWVPLNGDIAGLCVRTDTLRDAWWSPAGFNRGFIQNCVRLAWNPRKAYRDLLYAHGINPVISEPGQGTLLFGDKTMLSKPSAFDRINVRRLFIVIEKAISTAAKFTLFEFNDLFTRAQFVSMVEPYLNEVMGRRGIYDFRVVCDATNNTPEIIDGNQFVGDIYIKPARSINFIQLNFVAVRTGVDFSEIVGKF
jgi:phage tail sheath protein FI